MVLSDTLRDRTACKAGQTDGLRHSGDADGEVQSPRKCAALGAPDGPSSAPSAGNCRPLGEILRWERRLCAPDEITRYLSDGGAAGAARTVLERSGMSGDGADFCETRLPFVQKNWAPETENSGADEAGELSNVDEVRLRSVQYPKENGREKSEIRLRSVQFTREANGQNSRETFHFSDWPAGDDTLGDKLARPLDGGPVRGEKAQTLGYLSENRTQNVGGLPENGQNCQTASSPARSPMHESKSDFEEGLHEVKSEFLYGGMEALHEIESEFR